MKRAVNIKSARTNEDKTDN